MKRTRPSAVRRRKPRTAVLAWPHPDADEECPRAARLSRWTPTGDHTGEAVAFARAVAWLSGADVQQLPSVARAALRHADRLAADGVPLDAAQGLSQAQVEHTIATVVRPGTSPGATSTATLLRGAARTVHPAGWPAAAPGAGRKAPAAPYSPAETAALLDAATSLRSKRRRREMTVVVALTCGAGLTGAEITRTRWADITYDGDTAFVAVAGRTIPVLSAYAPALASAAGGQDPEAKVLVNTSDNGVWALHTYAREHGMDGWDVWRATNTWRVFQLCRVPLPVLARGLGLSSAHLAGLLAHCPEPDDDGLAALGDATGEGGAR